MLCPERQIEIDAQTTEDVVLEATLPQVKHLQLGTHQSCLLCLPYQDFVQPGITYFESDVEDIENRILQVTEHH